MTRTRPSLPKVDPSARDPIGSWLDVFVALLALPRAKRQTIRDELEDHLRSRVDDLLITGLAEPDAVRQAVSELGETADLARAFHAAAHPHHRRRLVMTATLFTLVGASVVVAVSTLTGVQPGTSHALHDSPHAPTGHPGATHPLIELRGQTFGSLLEHLKAFAGRPVLIHWDRLEQVGITPDTEVGLDVDPLPSYVVHRLLIERAEALGAEPIAVEESDELIEISVRSHFDRRTMELRTYDVRDLVELRSGIDASALAREGENGDWRGHAEQILHSISSLVEPDSWIDRDGDLARGQAVGASILIEAPSRLQDRVLAVLTMLRDDARRTRELAAEAEARARGDRERATAEVRAQLDTAAAEYAQLRARCERLMHERSAAGDTGTAEELLTELSLLEVQRDLAERRVVVLSNAIADSDVVAAPRGGLGGPAAALPAGSAR